MEAAELPYTDCLAFPDLIPCVHGWTLPPGSPKIPLNFAVVARRPLVQPKAVMYMSNPPVPDSEAGPIANRVRRTSNDNIQ